MLDKEIGDKKALEIKRLAIGAWQYKHCHGQLAREA
jgi:hypothetical protein